MKKCKGCRDNDRKARFDNKHTGGRFLQLTDSVFHFGFAEKVFAGVLLNKT